jgi:uncharacterized protein YukJ
MSSKTYGVYVGTPTSYSQQTLKQDPKSPHIYLKFGSSFESAINVRSTDGTDQGALVAWINPSFQNPITSLLSTLQQGFTTSTGPPASGSLGDGTQLDFLRTQPALFTWSAGQVVEDRASSTSTGTGDILSDLDPILTNAVNNQSTVYIFGTSYGTGIDDVHMNQGSTGNYENNIWQDGALLIQDAQSGTWQAVFLAFASQEVPTDDQGQPTANAEQVETLVDGSGNGGGNGGGNSNGQ